MALADTARLIASLELQDKFSATASKYEKTLGSMERKTSTAEKVGFQIGRGARNTIDNLGRIGLVAGGLIASQVALGVKSLAQLETITNQTNAVIKSTGAAAGVTADQIRAQAEALEDLTTIDDKAIQAGQNMLLTFTNVRNEVGEGNDIFTQATTAVLDLATAMGTEPKNAALQLGKALNDPVRGLTALRRVGIQFTADQEKQIKAMVEAGDTMGAQKVILAELNKEFGKSAEAFGKGPAADMRRFGDAIETAQQSLATGFLPVITRVSKLIQTTLADPQVQANIKSFGTSLAAGVEDLIDIATKLPWDAIGQSAKLMGQGAKALLDAFTAMPPWVQTAVLTGWGLNKLTGGAVGSIAGTLAKSLFGQIRGATPATPVFTKEVGIPGVGGAPVAGGGGGGGFLGTALKIAVPAAIAVGIAQGLRELALAQDPGSDARKAEFERSGAAFFGLFGGGKPLPVKVENLPATPLGQFVPANQGGTPAPSLGKGVIKTLDAQLARVQTQQTRFIRGGTDKQARILQGVIDSINVLRGDGKTSTNRFIAGLGKVHAGLSAANRNLSEGTQQQRATGRKVDQARERIGTGFQANREAINNSASRTADHLRNIRSQEAATTAQTSIVAKKDFSPSFTANVYATTQVSIDAINRAQTSARIAIGKGPLETFDH